MAKKKPQGMLAGVRVLDLTRVLAGPYCTMMLGDMGADVIKVEEPEKGDDTRQWGPPFTKSGMSAYFISANRNKRSLTLNIKSKAGQKVLKDLIKRSDVLVENFKPGTLERLKLGWPQLQKVRKGLIYCTISGYGYSGPDKDKPGYDFIIQARGGLMSVTGPIEGEPTRVGVAIGDLLAGIYACNAITAALFARERQKNAQRIDISLLDSMISTLSYVASNYLVSAELPKRFGNAHPNIVPYQSFKASDAYFAFAAGNDLQWRKFCRAVGRPEWAADLRFASNPNRVENRDQLIQILDNLFKTKAVHEWLKICEDAGVPAGPINTLNQTFSDPQILAREMLTQIELANGDRVKLVSSPLKTPTNPPVLKLPPPLLGQHTVEIFKKELGYSNKEIQTLRDKKVI